MFEAEHLFGLATRLEAEAIGKPGERTFRLLVEATDGRVACLWMEKEQLQALALAVEQLMAELQGRLASSASTGPEAGASQPFAKRPSVDLKVGRLALGQDETEPETGPRYMLLAYDLESLAEAEAAVPSGKAAFACRATRDQLRLLSRNIADVVAAGRPRCPLCGEPVQQLGSPHGCVRSNGHHG